MISKYLSVVYDLREFGIGKITRAILDSDKDDGITIEVSFNGGKSFMSPQLDKGFKVSNSTGQIQVRITFEDEENPNIYTVKTTGFYPNLEVGTTINFTNEETSDNYATNIGANGKYTISLPRGLYTLWFRGPTGQVVLMNSFNPEASISQTTRLDKENTIEMFFREVDWAQFSVFDTFENDDKMIYGNAIVDVNGDLSDGQTDRVCKYWAIGFSEYD